ncbi:hypothetical protein ANTRET_LOCUS10662 [Anthophora retusa]
MRSNISDAAYEGCAVAVMAPKFQADCVRQCVVFIQEFASTFQWRRRPCAVRMCSNCNDAAQEGCAVAVMALKFQADCVRQYTGYS